MAALNFPDPNVQTSYTNPDTGIAYEWANGLWKAVRTAQTAPELFVDADGDNLTGNLTLGTDKIVLDATTGAAAFADRIAAGSPDNGTSTVTTNYALTAYNTSATLPTIWARNGTANGPVFVGVNSAGVFTTTIKENGSATFAGGNLTITSAGRLDASEINSIGTAGFYAKSPSDSGYGLRVVDGSNTHVFDVNFQGNVMARRSVNLTNGYGAGTDGNAALFTRNAANDTTTSKINYDGSAEFAGSVSPNYVSALTDSGSFNFYRNKGTAAALNSAWGVENGTQTVKFYNNGSATFNGPITAENDLSNAVRATNNSGEHESNAAIIAKNKAALGLVLSGLNSSDTVTTKIYNNGDVTFAGNITAGNVSDIKFKENIKAATAQLADIEAFELKTFDWKDNAPLSDELKTQRKLGLIAQEVEAICPEMVYEVAGQDEDSYKAINHDVLIMKLLGAVKELAAEVAALKAS